MHIKNNPASFIPQNIIFIFPVYGQYCQSNYFVFYEIWGLFYLVCLKINYAWCNLNWFFDFIAFVVHLTFNIEVLQSFNSATSNQLITSNWKFGLYIFLCCCVLSCLKKGDINIINIYGFAIYTKLSYKTEWTIS